MRSIAVISVLCCLALVHSRDSASLSDKLEDLEKSKSKTSERTANRVDSIKMHAKSESERFYMYINSATKKLSEIKSETVLKLRNVVDTGHASRKGEHDAIENRLNNEGSGMESHLARYGLPGNVAKEVVMIASQQLPRDLIIQQLQRKYLNLEVHEVNDLIVSSHTHVGKPIPKLNDMKDADKLGDISKAKKIQKNIDNSPKEWFKSKN